MKKKIKCEIKDCGTGCGFYGLGFLGALAYYWIHATSFWEGFIGFLKAIVWPVFLVYEMLRLAGA